MFVAGVGLDSCSFILLSWHIQLSVTTWWKEVASSVVELLITRTITSWYSYWEAWRFELLAGRRGEKDGTSLPVCVSSGVGQLLALSETTHDSSDFAVVLFAGYANTMESFVPSGCGLLAE